MARVDYRILGDDFQAVKSGGSGRAVRAEGQLPCFSWKMESRCKPEPAAASSPA